MIKRSHLCQAWNQEKRPSDWNLFGEEAFSFAILEVLTKEEATLYKTDVEQMWMDSLQSYSTGYNICPLAKDSTGYKHTPEILEGIRERSKKQANRPEFKERISSTFSKQYEVTDPSGKTFVIKNLKKFCEDILQVNPDYLYQVASGYREHYKNWKCRLVE